MTIILTGDSGTLRNNLGGTTFTGVSIAGINVQAHHLISTNALSAAGYDVFLNQVNADTGGAFHFNINSNSNGVYLPANTTAQNALASAGYAGSIHLGRADGHRAIDDIIKPRLETLKKEYIDLKAEFGAEQAAKVLSAKLGALQTELRAGLTGSSLSAVKLFLNASDPGFGSQYTNIIEMSSFLKGELDTHTIQFDHDGNPFITISDGGIVRPSVINVASLEDAKDVLKIAKKNPLIGSASLILFVSAAGAANADAVKATYGDNSISSTLKFLGDVLPSDFNSAEVAQFVGGMALELAKDAILSMMGFGLLVYAKDLAESWGTIVSSLETLSEHTDSQVIDDISAVVTSIDSALGSFLGSGGSSTPPSVIQIARVIEQSFDIQFVQYIKSAVTVQIAKIAGDRLTVAQEAALYAAGPTDLSGVLSILAEIVGSDRSVLTDQIVTALILKDGVKGGKFSDEIAILVSMSDACFLGDTMVSLWGGGQKRIDQIIAGDWVTSYDKDGNLVPGKVTRTFAKRAKLILDVHGLMVTPGHVTLCGDGEFAGRHVPMIDILRSDGALVREDGSMVRAATGANLGSAEDHLLQAIAVANGPAGPETVTGQIRAGTRYVLENGLDVSMLELIQVAGGVVTETGLVRDATGAERPMIWPFGPTLPRPEDYVLARSNLPLRDIYVAGEWEDMQPRYRVPAPSVRTAEEVATNMPIQLTAESTDHPLTKPMVH